MNYSLCSLQIPRQPHHSHRELDRWKETFLPLAEHPLGPPYAIYRTEIAFFLSSIPPNIFDGERTAPDLRPRVGNRQVASGGFFSAETNRSQTKGGTFIKIPHVPSLATANMREVGAKLRGCEGCRIEGSLQEATCSNVFAQPDLLAFYGKLQENRRLTSDDQ